MCNTNDSIYLYRRFRCELETSVGDHSSVDRQGCAGDVGCLVRRNEHDGICDFFGVEDGLIVLGGYIGSRAGSALGASVIDGNLEATETSDGLVDEVLDFLFMPHIGAVKFGLRAELAQFTGLLR